MDPELELKIVTQLLRDLLTGVETMCKRDLKCKPSGEYYERAKAYIHTLDLQSAGKELMGKL